VQPSSRLSFSISAYYNVYDDLRSIEITPVTFVPLHWGNLMQGHTYGVEVWGEYRVTPWWRLVAAFDELDEHLTFKAGASGLLGAAQAGDDPKNQASLRSSMNLGRNVTLDADLRYVSALPSPFVPAYVELNSRIGWNVTDRVQLSLSGFNLLHAHHLEFPADGATAVPRSFLAELRWRF
jgi:iron complex outermembrane receptor protein